MNYKLPHHLAQRLFKLLDEDPRTMKPHHLLSELLDEALTKRELETKTK